MKSALLANQQWSSVVLQCLRETNCEHQVHLHVLELSAANPSKVRGEMELPITDVHTIKQLKLNHIWTCFPILPQSDCFQTSPFYFQVTSQMLCVFKENLTVKGLI